MTAQLAMPLERPRQPVSEQRLRRAFDRCQALRRRMPFERAVQDPLLRRCLELTAESATRMLVLMDGPLGAANKGGKQ